jgi:hypothetical protein
MARVPAVEPRQAGLLTRIVYALARRRVRQLTGVAKVPEPLRVTAHHGRLLGGLVAMELAQDAASRVPARLKTLASVAAATRIGCPY